MRIGVLSDTHGRVAAAIQAAELLRRESVDLVLHCGDVGSTEVMSVFTDWESHWVQGNCDGDAPLLANFATEHPTLHWHGLFADLELPGQRRLALLHSHEQSRFAATCEADRYALVCYGHTHHAEQHQVRNTLVLNPGALYRVSRKSIAIVEVHPTVLTARHLWLDPPDPR